MLTSEKAIKENSVEVYLKGTIDETTQLDQFLPQDSQRIDVYTRHIARINSMGVKEWMRAFQNLSRKGVQFRFFECSVAIVEQINLISNFTCGGEVVSIFIPFSCTKCRSELVGLFSSKILIKMNLQVPELKCPKCNSLALFDDIEEEYFAFLQKP